MIKPQKKHVLYFVQVIYNGAKVVWSSGTSGITGAYAKMRIDGNFVIYSEKMVVLWETRSKMFDDVQAVMQNDGRLVLIDGGDEQLWSSGESLKLPIINVFSFLLPTDSGRCLNQCIHIRQALWSYMTKIYNFEFMTIVILIQ